MTETKFKFYEQNDYPLSVYHNTSQWESLSPMALFYAQTDGAVYIEEMDWADVEEAGGGWRLRDIYWSIEDSLITYFRAYGEHGEHLAHASFGVADKKYTIDPTGFKYLKSNKLYVPAQNNLQTQNTGGYIVEVLEGEHPSERVHFGQRPKGEHPHQCPRLGFQWYSLGPEGRYPNDWLIP